MLRRFELRNRDRCHTDDLARRRWRCGRHRRVNSLGPRCRWRRGRDGGRIRDRLVAQPEILDQLIVVLMPPAWHFVHHLHHHARDLRRALRAHRAQIRHRHGDVMQHDRQRRVATVRRLAADEVEKRAAQAVNIRTQVRVLFSLRPLRTHVMRRTRRHTLGRKRPHLAQRMSESQSRELHLAFLREQNGIRLHIPVDDLRLAPAVIQRRGHMRADGDSLRQCEPSLAPEPRLRIRALDKFHRDPMHTIRLASRVREGEIGMVQRDGDLRIAAKTCDHFRGRGRRSLQDLQRDDAIRRDLPCLVQRAGTTLAEPPEDFKVTESLPVLKHKPESLRP